jgi:4-alpha-glucanotransferase
VLLHVTSLPGGRLGPAAYAFVDWLAAAGQSWWQMLPVGPPDAHGSPYAARSAFAGWPGLLADPASSVSGTELAGFIREHAFWAGDWADFAGADAIADQVRFQREWTALRAYARERGVRLVGDLPIFVAPGSADHLAHADLFTPGVVAGCPPDAFSETGQHWGNPVYDWPALRRTGYRWWIERFRRMAELFDVVRVDHFRGFTAAWHVPAEDETAMNGHWHRGPGAAVFRAAERELGPLGLIAEDLGVITPGVKRLRDDLGLPGIVILQYAFSSNPKSPYWLSNHVENSVVYTGTHDHAPIAAFWDEEATPREKARAEAQMAAAGIDDPEPHWRLIRLALSSRARTAILPAQDVLGLGSEARMNLPATEDGNWTWRLEKGALDGALAARLKAAAAAAFRRPDVR